MNTLVSTKPSSVELVFADEEAVTRHYDVAVQRESRGLQEQVEGVISSHKTKVVAYGAIGAVGTVILGMFLWSVVLPVMVGLALAAVIGVGGLVAALRLPAWISKVRVKTEVELVRLGNMRILALRQEEMNHLQRLKDQAAANPIPTRERYAQEAAEEIVEARQKAANFEGLIATQRQYVAQMKREYPETDITAQEAMIAELVAAHQTMVKQTNDADTALQVYKRQTGLLSLQLKTMAGVQSMAEFLRGDSAKRQLEKLLSDTATQSANTQIETAMSELRTSVSVVNSKQPH